MFLSVRIPPEGEILSQVTPPLVPDAVARKYLGEGAVTLRVCVAGSAPATVALMLALLRGDWESADRSERRHRVECSGLVAAYLQWHLEHSIRSLRHVERV